MNYKKFLKRKREEVGLSTRGLANKVGVTGSYISMIETGKSKNPPSEKILKKLSEALHMEPSEEKMFFDLVDEEILPDRIKEKLKSLDIKINMKGLIKTKENKSLKIETIECQLDKLIPENKTTSRVIEILLENKKIFLFYPNTKIEDNILYFLLEKDKNDKEIKSYCLYYLFKIFIDATTSINFKGSVGEINLILKSIVPFTQRYEYEHLNKLLPTGVFIEFDGSILSCGISVCENVQQANISFYEK